MDANVPAGVGIVLLGGLAAALYLLPFRAVRGWKYETGWLVCILAGWVAFPLVFDACVVPGLPSVLSSDGVWTFVRTVLFGMLWGVGALCWALMVRYLGIGLGLAIGAGLCSATGTLLPPIVGGRAASLVATTGDVVVLVGVLVALVGIGFIGAAGRNKEGEMSAEEKRRAVREYDFRKGVVMAVVAGFASAGINFGLQGAPTWESAALAQGASPIWAGMPVLTVTIWGGVLVQLGWCLVQHVRNQSFGDYVRRGSLVRNYFLGAAVGVVGISQFVLQKIAEPLLGDVRYISFAVLMSSAIFFSTGVGLVCGEWRGTSRRTRVLLAAGIALLVAAFVLMGAKGWIEAGKTAAAA